MRSNINAIQLESTLHDLWWMMHCFDLISDREMYTEQLEEGCKKYLLRVIEKACTDEQL